MFTILIVKLMDKLYCYLFLRLCTYSMFVALDNINFFAYCYQHILNLKKNSHRVLKLLF